MATKRSITSDNADEFVRTVLKRYNQDIEDRAGWSDDRLQRYAKLRGWLSPKSYPWPDASNQHIPLMMSNSQRMQDTLHNAVMSSRPIMSAIALNKADSSKGEQIDKLQDYQLFVEQKGEEILSHLITSFIEDGKFIAFIPWVRDEREVVTITPIPPLPPETESPWIFYFELARRAIDPSAVITKDNADGTQWTATWRDAQYHEQTAKIEFYEDHTQRMVMQLTRKEAVFDGPCVIPKSLEDMVVPSRAENLQPPGPSNPNGSDHVIMVDMPSYDEIKRLYDAGYYDLLDSEGMDKIEARAMAERGQAPPREATDPDTHKSQRDELAGQHYSNSDTASKTLTRLTYFGRWDLDGDGLEEEIVARVILEEKLLLRIRLLQEEYPTPTPRRPFAEGTLFPVQGQFYGISLLELLEHTQDLMKVILDQMIDKHTISNVPWGFYRSASGIRPENIRVEPGTLYPVSNPQQDVFYPTFPLNDQAVAMNILAYMGQWADKLSMQGQLQFGGVPQGKASALRTSTNMMAVLQQGDARPERILRRFFRGLSEIYQQMHELNQAFLPPNKQYRVSGVPPAGGDPYEMVSPEHITGRFQFDFKANALNTSKAARAQILQQLAPALINGMTFQSGLTDVNKFYNYLHDLIQSMGQDDTRYLNAPPQANLPQITAYQAVGQIVWGTLPQGLPAEGVQAHLAILQQIAQDPRFALLMQTDPAIFPIFDAYLKQVQALGLQQQQQAMMAQQFAASMGGGSAPGPEGAVDQQAGEMMPQGAGQVMDESLPGAKGMV